MATARGQAPLRQGYEGQAPLRQGYEGQAPLRQGYEGQAPLRQGYEGQAPLRQGYEGQGKIMQTLDFNTAFKYPFNRPKGMLNILWVLLPIIGWFALGGYGVRIIKEFSRGEFKELPAFKFSSDLELGFMMFIKSIPFLVAYGITTTILDRVDSGLAELVNFLIAILVIPILSINFMNKETVGSLFEFKILKSVFDNFGDYIMALLKSFLIGIIFLVMWIVLVGIPAGSFTKNIFLADFYRRRVK